ncbi:MAG: prolyl oligopeptidase family serine peptidase [Rhodopseudomonas sp.]|nr:prolyl oligopeptidase family serine peptidase [Rhodopseudomonas sp.]
MIGRALFALIVALLATPAGAQTYHREDLRIPMREAGAAGLEAMLLRPDAPGRYPLVLLSHGAPRDGRDRAKMTATSQYPVAMEFARRGFAVAVVMRRGYGNSGGGFAENRRGCSDPDYVTPTKTAVRDLKAAIHALSARSDIDGSRIVAVGQSAGGLATVGLAADPPPGLVAAISFAGGRGSRADYDVCRADRLVAAFHTFGKTARVPMLWVYTANDHFFAPPLADKLYAAFTGAGGNADYIHAPAFGKDGHQLFSSAGIPLWTPYVDAFLAQHKLTQRAKPMDLPPLPNLKPPPQLSARGREAFALFLRAGPHKAFAVNPGGYFGWRSGRRSTEDAVAGALEFCRSAGAKDCRIFVVDDKATN